MVIIGKDFLQFSKTEINLSEYTEQEQQQLKSEVETWAKQHDQKIIYAGN